MVWMRLFSPGFMGNRGCAYLTGAGAMVLGTLIGLDVSAHLNGCGIEWLVVLYSKV